jgi:hypothetical protein
MKKVLNRIDAVRLAPLLFLAAAVLCLTPSPSKEQVPSTAPPYNIDRGVGSNGAQVPLIALSAQAPATVNSAQQGNLDKEGVICTLAVTAVSGSPTVTVNVQNYDYASGDYYTVITSGAISVSTSTVQSVYVHPGAQTASLPTAVSAASGLSISRYWRVQAVVAVSSTTATGTVGWNVVK